MLKILQTSLQQYVNREIIDVQAVFRKGRGTRDQIANICWIIEKAREFHKNIYFWFTDYAKAYMGHIVKAMVLPAVIYGCESWTIKKAEHQRTDAFELWC